MIDLHNSDWSGASVKIKDAVSLTPYEYGVEYGSPARGLWNIVHTGMLLPESHQGYAKLNRGPLNSPYLSMRS